MGIWAYTAVYSAPSKSLAGPTGLNVDLANINQFHLPLCLFEWKCFVQIFYLLFGNSFPRLSQEIEPMKSNKMLKPRFRCC
jgi:hypothetical protein